MRGLGIRARKMMKAGSTAVAVFAALGLLLSACATGGTGTRDEGPARVDRAPGIAAPDSPSASPSPSKTAQEKVDPVKLVQGDPLVSPEIKRDLKPCAEDAYPVTAFYGELTGGSRDDVVVNVRTCADDVGIGTYVYRADGNKYENVFRSEESPVAGDIDDSGDLVVTKQYYKKGDPVAYPSSEEVTTYRWKNDHFKQIRSNTRDYGSSVGGAAPTPAED